MDATTAVSALAGLLGALVGAAAGYLGAVRAAARGNRPAWTSAAVDAARLLLASEDPANRAEGSRLLEAAARAIGGAADAPGQLRRATRGRHLSVTLERAGAAAAAGAAPRFARADASRRTAVGDAAVSDGAITVTAQDVDAAAAEVRAFRAAGLHPDPTVVRLAEVKPG